MSELNKLTLADARDLLRKKDITSVELTEACLQAKGGGKALNAFVHDTSEVALGQAKAADGRLAEGDAPSMCGLQSVSRIYFVPKAFQAKRRAKSLMVFGLSMKALLVKSCLMMVLLW